MNKLTDEALARRARCLRTPSVTLEHLALQRPALMVDVLQNPALSLRGLERLLAELLPFAPQPAHALAVARNPCLPMLFFQEPTAIGSIPRLLLQLGDGVRRGAEAIGEQLPWQHRDLLLASYDQLKALEGTLDLFAGEPGTRFQRPRHQSSWTTSERQVDLEAIQHLTCWDGPRGSLLWLDPRFVIGESILQRAIERETHEALLLSLRMFRLFEQVGVQPPALWLALLTCLGQ